MFKFFEYKNPDLRIRFQSKSRNGVCKINAVVVFISAFYLALSFFVAPFKSIASTGRNGGHDVVGCANPSRKWYFAEGCTRPGFEEYICLLNPGNKAVKASFSYMLETGEIISKAHDIPGARRITVPVLHDVPAGHDVSLLIESTEPLIAERPIYFDYSERCNGAHCTTGATSPRKEWYFAEGCTRQGFDTYLCIMNPHDSEAIAQVLYIRENGGYFRKP